MRGACFVGALRAAGVFPAMTFFGAIFLAATFFAVTFLAATLGAGFFAGAFFAGGFFAAAFFAGAFFAAAFFAFVAMVVLSCVVSWWEQCRSSFVHAAATRFQPSSASSRSHTANSASSPLAVGDSRVSFVAHAVRQAALRRGDRGRSSGQDQSQGQVLRLAASVLVQRERDAELLQILGRDRFPHRYVHRRLPGHAEQRLLPSRRAK